MKKRIFSLCTFLFLNLNTFLLPQSNIWQNISLQIPGDSLNNLSGVSVPNRWISYASSSSYSEIYRTDFSPVPWEVLQTPSPVTSLKMTEYDYGFMCGIDSSVYLTTDAGVTWIYFGTLEESINDIDISLLPFDLKGYVCANNGVIGVIEDTGLVITQSGLATDFIRVSAPMEDKVWLAGDSSVYFFDGSTFTKQFTAITKINSVHFMDDQYGWIVGDSGYISQTTDGGNNWNQQFNPDTLYRTLNDIHLAGPYGWAVGDVGLILSTTNGGDVWSIESAGITQNNLTRIHCTGYSVEFGPAMAIGENKTVLIWPLVVSVDDEESALNDFQLFQNYPNPFNPTTRIKYSIPQTPLSFGEGQGVSLVVYDILGNEIATLVNDEKPAGEYEVEFAGSALTSGIYFYQLRSNEFVQTKKMTFLK